MKHRLEPGAGVPVFLGGLPRQEVHEELHVVIAQVGRQRQAVLFVQFAGQELL